MSEAFGCRLAFAGCSWQEGAAMANLEAVRMAFLGFFSIAMLTWFFSSRTRLFIRVFVPRDQLFAAGRSILHPREEFRRGMRLISWLQFFVACGFGIAWLWQWLGMG
jgi:hypothetical protein